MGGKHSQLSPSAASRWMNCPGSVRRIQELAPDSDETSIFAAEGTAAHWVREVSLAYGFSPYDFVGTRIQADGFMFVVDEDMADHLIPGIDRIHEFEGRLFSEVRVNTTPWVGYDDDGDEQGGTVDSGVVGPEEIVISDLKYGQGVPVSPVDNKQLQLYALGFWRDIGRHHSTATRVRIIIDQPRHSAGGGEWVTTIDELKKFGQQVKRAATETRNPDAPCVPSEAACQWCPLARMDGACPEHESWKLDILGLDFDDLDSDEPPRLPDREGMTTARRRYINQHASMIRSWLDRLHADEIADLLENGPSNGVKTVAGRAGRRNHKDEKASERWLLNNGFKRFDIINKKLITVAKIDELAGKGVFPRRLVHQNDPKPIVVPLEDERPALMSEIEFEDLGCSHD
ncbi:DUF2800 domain-containing protein [Roseibium sediminis]|uniref:DUF2800 domain-containing protein n=1 Tax=Roseibium sediminis TaxID=1775174 RepID=UPI00123CF53F|nr:DUF2800 domain-containing protein [Roseibium sediminis]